MRRRERAKKNYIDSLFKQNLTRDSGANAERLERYGTAHPYLAFFPLVTSGFQ
jgi:hypothetical protein